jgi:hypothetical protein
MSDKTDKIEQCLRDLLSTIKVHECTCFSCDRDGEQYCDCLLKAAEAAKKVLNND